MGFLSRHERAEAAKRSPTPSVTITTKPPARPVQQVGHSLLLPAPLRKELSPMGAVPPGAATRPGPLPRQTLSATCAESPILPPDHDPRDRPGLGRPRQATTGQALGLRSLPEKHRMP
ncbi:uncharacterized protein LOC117803952 isoform X2 [Ailuropoda melanoleuca]|uniref:uncharacterized protein LOC117803952 isoform X2 n=1 Tax=Ailuropoda melanoleuca TaxID=9646 RepID=UPI0014940E23|nr:uncharacterized protein LOC117803952 isoform X2 [Ailuropoda melanoleuca]